MSWGQHLLDTYLSRFCNRLDVYCIQHIYWDSNEQRKKFMYYPVRQPVTREVLLDHLQGIITIGWPPFDCEGYSKWLCFDSDTNDKQLDKLQTFLEQYGWHYCREGKRYDSKEQIMKDGHLWLFFDSPILASQLKILAKAMMKGAGVSIGEVFPKQDKAKLGNVVRGPLGIHRKDGANNCRGWFEVPPEDIGTQLEWLSEQPLNSSTTAMELAHQHAPVPRPRFIRRSKGQQTDFIAYATANGFRTDGDELIGPCPGCVNIGHDPTHEHLSVNVAKNVLHCWRGCQFADIIRAMRGTNSGAA